MLTNLNHGPSISVSYRTIRRIRQKLGFRPVHYRRRALLTEGHKRKRLQYALDNLDEDWKKIIFTDESTFELTDKHCVIWKRPSSPSIIKGVVQHEISVMVWGGVWWEGRTKLCIVNGTIDSDVYQKIIKDYLISPHITDDLELLQDRAPAHRAIATIEYFE